MPRKFRSLTCCFTGHRPEKLPWGNNEEDPRCVALKERIFDAAEAVYFGGIRHYICGMARGCDLYFCEAVIRLRDEHPDITLEAAIPCETQTNDWPEKERSRYFYLVAQCDDETLLQTSFTPDCMIKRNKYMVDNASILIAAYNGTFGGTMQTVNYAKASGLEIIELNVDEE